EAKAQALAQAVEREPIKFGDWSAPLHISYGVRQISPDLEPEALVAEADAAMFAAKRLRGVG
ncbi:MAG: dgcA, partial [Phenylobacterium sp.]|nr:dgcA [Phenylobacterium sp.]